VASPQNAAAALQLHFEDSSSGSRNTGTGSDSKRRQEQRLRLLLSGSIAAAVDALPAGDTDTMAADPGGGSAQWLARAMQELGYACTANEAAFKNLLKQFPGRVDEPAVAEALGLMARTVRGLEPDGLGLSATLAAVLAEGGAPAAPLGEAGSATWNVGVVVDVIRAAAPALAWRRVAELLDRDGFIVPEPAGLGILTTALRRATGESLPISALVGRVWGNAAGQLSLLAAATVAPPDAVAWDASPRRVAPLDGLAGGASPSGTANGCWLSVDLLSVLCQLADAGQAVAVRNLLEAGPGKSCREVLLCSLGALQPAGDADWGPLQRALWSTLLPPYLAGHANSPLVLRRLWDSNATALLKGMGLWAGGDPARVSQVLDVVQQLGALPAALDAAPPELALDLADAAARRELLGATMDNWLAERLARHGAALARPVVMYLETRMNPGAAAAAQQQLPPDAARAPPPQLARETAACFLRGLHSFVAVGGGAEFGGDVARVQAQAAAAYPGSEALLAAAAVVPATGAGAGPFPTDVEDDANAHFQQIYSENRPVAEVVEQMRRAKTGGVPRQMDVFNCMVHNLLDEFRFFPNYPDKELSVTAQLFGCLVGANLFSGVDLGVATQCVLTALAEPPDTKLFSFGLGALRQFCGDLARWPAFCSSAAASLGRIRSAAASLADDLERALAAQQRSSGAGGTDAGKRPGALDASQTNGSGGGAGEQQQGGAAAAVAAKAAKAKAGGDPDITAHSINVTDSVGGSGTGEALNKLLQVNVAQAAALSTLNEKPAALSLSTTMNNETLESAERRLEEFKGPPDAAADKVSFIMNNLSKQNLVAKARDLNGLVIAPGYVDWFANYLTVKRAAQVGGGRGGLIG
jgi:CCR4-NOT transcription complex subunit 1